MHPPPRDDVLGDWILVGPRNNTTLCPSVSLQFLAPPEVHFIGTRRYLKIVMWYVVGSLINGVRVYVCGQASRLRLDQCFAHSFFHFTFHFSASGSKAGGLLYMRLDVRFKQLKAVSAQPPLATTLATALATTFATTLATTLAIFTAIPSAVEQFCSARLGVGR